MIFRKTVFLALVLFGFFAVHAFAHDEFRIVGTISKVAKTQLQVTTTDRKTYSIALDNQTLISRDKKKVSADELKLGRTVVVDAIGDSERDLLALEVRLVPAIAK
jgi:hypothetical protein